MKRLLVFITALSISGGAFAAEIGAARIGHPTAGDSSPGVRAGEDAQARRTRSNAVMRAQGVPINATLPVIESEREVVLPSREDVTMRAVATTLVALKGEGLEQAQIERLIRRYALTKWLSPEEARFLKNPAPTEKQRAVSIWRYEAANTLFWALGLVDHLGPPRDQCDAAAIARILDEHDRAELLAKVHLRSTAEILDQADLIYSYRWALVDARINALPPPAGLSDDVAMERHQALNWLIYHAEQPWDEITLDT
ncbi:DUF4272 domain-containing protein [Sphingomonas echinoides]|uniref:DUF4272 domain-containing protein n=1 Tax=Sphingomonas echinoides TaxID=59803 RepID=A0ABU4PI97_9SPHN|nr:DUF4272 domain-containing protein [Sphingomonas echinoides]MDX5982812.1 DUF4272 domain-containing protein [Sphingomonas echinoides]